MIREGAIEFLYREQPEIFAYRRLLEGEELVVLNNLTNREVVLPEAVSCQNSICLLHNYPEELFQNTLEMLRPYESLVLFKRYS